MPVTVQLPPGYDVRDPEQLRLRNAYDGGDRSDAAKRAKSLYNAWYRQSRKRSEPETVDAKPIPRPEPPVAAIGAARRLQALAYMGYDLALLAEKTSIQPPYVLQLLFNPPAQIPAALHRAIAAKYRQLMIVKPDDSAASIQMRRIARAASWPGPAIWDDIDQGIRGSVAHNAKDAATQQDTDPEPERSALEVQQLRAEIERLSHLARQQEADLTRVLADQRRADQEHTATAAAVDEYAALKLKAEGDCSDIRAALVEAGDEIDRLKTSNSIFREQIVESEDRATAANARALAAERDALQLRDELVLEQEAYRKLHASHRQLQQSFDELAALKAVHEPTEVAPASRSPRVGELVVEQTADGTRLVYTSRKTARVLLGGIEVELPA